jgi:hypothetical protein
VNVLGRIAQFYVPTFVKKRQLKELFHITGAAFGIDVPRLAGQTYAEYLVEYARFTKSAVERSIDNLYDLGSARQELCHRSFNLGDKIRRRFGISSKRDVMIACGVIYKSLGIEFRGTDEGEITIHSCFFSKYYSEQVCGVISCLDKGLVAGLSGGGKMSFTQKITEGMDCCKAILVPQENGNEISNRRRYRCWWCNCC